MLQTIVRPFASLGLPPRALVLTFDDGPNPADEITRRLLQVLDRHRLRAGFCLIGKCAEAHPGLTRDLYAAGHVLINHSYSHRPLFACSPATVHRELDRWDQTLAQVLARPGFSSPWVRPPYGLYGPLLEDILAARGARLATLSWFGFDNLASPATSGHLFARTWSSLQRDQGGLLVLHDRRLRFYPEPAWWVRHPHSGANRSWVPAFVDRLLSAAPAAGFHLTPFPSSPPSAGLPPSSP